MGKSILHASGISKRFGPVTALAGVDFHVETGEIHALLGINGAGKSTFIKILSGIIGKDTGQLQIAGQDVNFHGPKDAINAGIATVQQHPELVADMTGLDCIFLGRECPARGLFSRIDTRTLEERAKALMSRFAVPLDLLDRIVADMTAVERELVAILQALAEKNIKVLILDEPTSTLTDVEREDLFELMDELRRQGISIIYITHQLEEVFTIADSFSVFRNGECVARMSVEDAQRQKMSLATLMLGEEIGDLYPTRARTPEPGETVLSLTGFTLEEAFENIHLDARRGEILGIFGLVGSGCEELAKAIYGVLHPTSGEMRLRGAVLSPRTPCDALGAGIFLVPGDRRKEGLALGRSSLFNVPLANLRRASGGHWMLRHRHIREDARKITESMALHPPHLQTPASDFSGGNQQKIVLSKGLYSEADLYIFVEPTIGVDVGARAKIYWLIHDLSADAAVIVISSDCDEINGVADRTIALHKGRQVTPARGQFSRDELLMAGIMGRSHS